MAEAVAAHIPVLLQETMELLDPVDGGIYVDATLGPGGHAEAVLERSAPSGRLIGFEWDEEAAGLARERLARFGQRFRLVETSYAHLRSGLAACGVGTVDGIIADLGVSSLQLDRADRGFSFMSDGPLDMRMSTGTERNAADILAEAGEAELADIFFHYGEERQARRIARHLVEARAVGQITTTRGLADLVYRAVPRRFHPKRVHVATRVFQALRIAVNRELDNVRRLLLDAPGVLRPGGRLLIISFHSLEDRMVKQALRNDAALRGLTRHPLEPSAREIAANPRSRSAKLRAAERRDRATGNLNQGGPV